MRARISTTECGQSAHTLLTRNCPHHPCCHILEYLQIILHIQKDKRKMHSCCVWLWLKYICIAINEKNWRFTYFVYCLKKIIQNAIIIFSFYHDCNFPEYFVRTYFTKRHDFAVTFQKNLTAPATCFCISHSTTISMTSRVRGRSPRFTVTYPSRTTRCAGTWHASTVPITWW